MFLHHFLMHIWVFLTSLWRIMDILDEHHVLVVLKGRMNTLDGYNIHKKVKSKDPFMINQRNLTCTCE